MELFFMTVSLKDLLSGPNAFYAQPTYLKDTQRSFAAKALPISYKWNAESKVTTVFWQVFSCLIFPITATYNLIHSLIGRIVLPASTPWLMNRPGDIAAQCRSEIDINNDKEWKYKRLFVQVDDHVVDMMLVGKPSTFSNGKWMLSSNGNGELYEVKLAYDQEFMHLLELTGSNALVFNYPSVGDSPGSPNQESMVKAYKLMLRILTEDKEYGIGASHLIGYGHSIGGGVQGEALKDHALKKGVKEVFIKSRTFSSLSATVSYMTTSLLGLLVKIFGWEMDSTESSKKLQAPEIILQTVDSEGEICHDGVIPAEATLMRALYEDPSFHKENKVFMKIENRHNELLSYTQLQLLACQIDTLFKKSLGMRIR